MLLTPRLGNLGCLIERGAHRSAPFPIWIEPDWKFDGFVHHSAGAIVRFLYPVFDAQRLIGQFTDRYQRAPAQFTAERWFTALFAVAQHTDVKVVVDGVRFGATDAQIMNKLVSIVASSSAFRLPASPPPKGSSIDSDWSTKNKKQPGFLRLISAWYAMVCLHFFWHHENYDSHVPAVTGWSPVAKPSPECSNARPFCDFRRDALNTARSLLDSTHRSNAS